MKTWQQPARRVILASGSPRRKELLGRMGIIFETIPGEPIDENKFIDISDLHGSLQRLAVEKAQCVASIHPEAVVLSADTIVVGKGTILGKPADRKEARSMLLMLSGCIHTVMTGMAIVCREKDFYRSTTVSTKVYFRNISEPEIEWYLNSNEPYDKAGAYGIQGKAMIFIDKIEGCFYNVVGLPVSGTIDLLNEFVR